MIGAVAREPAEPIVGTARRAAPGGRTPAPSASASHSAMSPCMLPPPKRSLGQQAGRIGHPAVEGELVVGLLVRARVGGRAAAPALGDDGDIVLPEISEPDGRRERRGAGPDDDGVDAAHRDRRPGDRQPVLGHGALRAARVALRCSDE
ncbi:MAG: hypothetical protein MZV64_43005 [Ignavibacteriales bacterium]|nr:hypothetical protein [Ignavibacteriales bacterium]